jgi:transposase
MQPNSEKTRKPMNLIHMDNARVHTTKAAQEKLDVSRFRRTPKLLYRPDIAPSGSFLGWLKTQLERRECNGEDELCDGVDEILTGLSIEMIETVFVDWMNRLQRLIDGNGDCLC